MRYISSNKKNVQLLVDYCYQLGVNHVVISPGSRNAPLIIGFGNHPSFKCHSIVDERSAAFYALGMARELGKPVAIVCTSGSAALNFSPAVVEAWYQEVPLLVITADRPPEMIDQEDGQTIKQPGIYNNFIKHTLSLPVDDAELEYEKVKSAFIASLYQLKKKPYGPVHINIPFNEPLYEKSTASCSKSSVFVEKEQDEFLYMPFWANEFNRHGKILLVSGVNMPNNELKNIIDDFSKKLRVPVLAGSSANLSGELVLNKVDVLLHAIQKQQREEFIPDLLITIGGPVLSKPLKQMLRTGAIAAHWDIDENPKMVNTYECLSNKIDGNPVEVLGNFIRNFQPKQNEYLERWLKLNSMIEERLKPVLSDMTWCDLKAIDVLLNSLPQSINLHLANSMAIRYVELFDVQKQIKYFSNRGTNGIDGSTSTMAGAAAVSSCLNVLLTGDVSFLYDSNAMWNKNLTANFKVVVLNNEGGNIFKVIKGPEESGHLQEFFEAHHPVNIKDLTKSYGLSYFSANSERTLVDVFNSFIEIDRPAVLEVFTDSNESALMYRNFIKSVK